MTKALQVIFISFSLFIFSSCSSHDLKLKDDETIDNSRLEENIDSLDKNYGFSVSVDVKDLMRNNEHNYKYLINLGWDKNKSDSLIFFESNLLQRINYQYLKNPNRLDEYERVPVDTIKITLDSSQLDSIYFLTAKMFQLDSENLVANSNYVMPPYDGWFTSINFFIDQIGKFSLDLDGLASADLLQEYYNLHQYLDEICDIDFKEPKL